MKKTTLLIPLALAVSVCIHAQSIGPSTLNALGGTAVIGTNEFDWSVGEMAMVSTFTAPGIIITQGLLQPAGESINAVPGEQLLRRLQVFPNPATSVVNIQYSGTGQGTLSYRLMDMMGKTVVAQTINTTPGATSGQVNINELACATYMLEVTVNTGNAASERISYKIQKIK